MDVNIFAQFEDNKIDFTLSLPIELVDINIDEYYNIENTTVYSSNNTNIDLNVLYKNIDVLMNKINNIFYKEKNIKKEYNISIHIISNENNLMALDFIKNNKNLNIVFSVSDFKEIIDNLKDEEYPNLKISFKNSKSSISYKEFYKMYKKLNEIVEFINHYNLSPLEKVLLVYDIVKANEYKKENKDEAYSVSRDLNEIINNNKIVCVGFSNLIDFLLKNLGIKSNTTILGYENKEIQHERNYIYLKDDKYNINGIFFLDATWDSKRNDKYLDNYTYFLKPFLFFNSGKNKEYVVSPKKFKILEKNKDEIIEDVKNSNEIELFRFSLTLVQLIKEYNPNIGSIINLKDKSPNELLDTLTEINKMYNKKIPKEAFKNALYKVRKIEYINGIIKFELNEEYIDEVCSKYYKETPETRLLKLLDLYEEPTLNKDLDEAKANSTEEDLLRMRFLKALKEKINDKPENDYIKKM